MKLASLVALALTVVAAGTCADAAAVQLRDGLVVKERVHAPRDWVRRSAVADATPATFRIGLKRRGIAELEAKLQHLSDPDSPQYAKWYSKDQLHALVSPSPESRAAVADWLESNGVAEDVSRRSDMGDYLTVRTTYGQARDVLLGSQFHTYQHRTTGEVVVRTEELTLPRAVAEHIDVVYPSTNFGSPRRAAATHHVIEFHDDETDGSRLLTSKLTDAAGSSSSQHNGTGSDDGQAPASCQVKSTTLPCIQDLYQTPNATLHTRVGESRLAIAGFLEEYANYQDFSQYKDRLAPYAKNYAYKTTTVHGGGNNQTLSAAGVEANLDVQAAVLAYPIPVTYYSVGGRGSWIKQPDTQSNTNEPYATLLEYVNGLSDAELPQVLSHSYDDDEFSVAPSYAQRVCQDILLLTVRGTTAVFASGDYGVGNDGTCEIDGKKQFIPQFPSTCPWALSVGATERYAPEVAVSSDVAGFYSGGGFSHAFPRPWYQSDLVDPYVAHLDSALKPYYNHTGRGVPDVAAQGSKYLIRVGGRWGLVGGTSAATPTFASVLALLNDARAAKGIPSLGFVNPLLYKRASHGKGLKDIVQGASVGCGELPAPANQGFPAKKGWDAVTGLGTPVYPELEKIVTFSHK